MTSFDHARPDFAPYGFTCERWTARQMRRPDRHNEIEVNLLGEGPLTYLLGGRKVVLYPLFHPAAALRTPATKQELRADIHRLPEILEHYIPAAVEAEEAEPAEPEAEQLGLFAGG